MKSSPFQKLGLCQCSYVATLMSSCARLDKETHVEDLVS
jgi:hypothetical protein